MKTEEAACLAPALQSISTESNEAEDSAASLSLFPSVKKVFGGGCDADPT
jgi:hypothetical protein